MKTLILYHRDLDGLASALIARKEFPDARMVDVQYGEEIPVIKENEERIILVDFSYDKDTMNFLQKTAKEFIWIDHHKTASKLFMWDLPNIKGKRSLDKAACMLTWEYFNKGNEKAYPYGIRLIADRDMWKFEYGNDTKAFNEYLQFYDLKNDIEKIESLIFSDVGAINTYIDEGLILLKYKEAMIKKIVKSGEIEQLDMGCPYEEVTFTCYSNIFISDIADYVFKNYEEVEIVEIHKIKFVDKKWKTITSLRSRGKVDVSKIAEEHGGGGHHNAAGYTVEGI